MSIESSIQLPEDVLMDILSRIPAKSLLQFKSVSKHWYSLIQNPYFISLHHSRAQPCIFISTLKLVDLDTYKSSMFLLPDQTSIQDLDLSFTTPPHNKDSCVYDSESCVYDSESCFYDSCNGLICLLDFPSIVICNPAIREFRVLPQPPYESRRTSTTNLGFGFDPKSNDYKVLRVATLYEYVIKADHWDWMRVDHKIQIYGMSTDSWKEIVAMVPSEHGCCPSCISLYGVFYWLWNDYSTNISVIHTFRMFEELFERIPFPDAFSNIIVEELYILKNSPAVILPEYDHEPRGARFDIWVMDEYEVMKSWTKKYTVGPLSGEYRSRGFRPDVEVLLMSRYPKNVVSYNLSSGDIDEYNQLCDRPGAEYVAHVLAYSESLISVKIRVD